MIVRSRSGKGALARTHIQRHTKTKCILFKWDGYSAFFFEFGSNWTRTHSYFCSVHIVFAISVRPAALFIPEDYQTNNNKRATKESTTTGIQVPSTEFENEWRAHINTVTIMLVLVVAPCIKRRKRMWSMKHLLPNNYSSTEI